jgi:hypothetical protein
MAGPTIDQAFIDDFNQDVHLVYRYKGSKLKGMLRTDADVQAKKVRFQKLGKISTTSKARNGDIVPANPEHTYVDCPIDDRYTLDFVDQLDLTKLNIALREGYVQNHVDAFGEYTDQQIIDAMNGGGGITLDNSSGGIDSTVNNLTRNVVLRVCQELDENNVPDDGTRFGALTPAAWAHLMTFSEFASGDYVGPDLPYKQMGTEMRTWGGVNWIKCNLLPGTGTASAKCFVWHMRSCGHAIQQEPDITWDWENTKKAWSAAGSMAMGAVVIDSTGLAEITIDDTAALKTT